MHLGDGLAINARKSTELLGRSVRSIAQELLRALAVITPAAGAREPGGPRALGLTYGPRRPGRLLTEQPMAHDVLHDSLERQTGRTSTLIVGILLGGVLVLSSYIADIPAIRQALFADNPFYSDLLALLGAVMLGVPIIIHAARELSHGHMHMDELVGLAVIAAIAGGRYKEAGLVAFFLLLSNLIERRTALGARASIEVLPKLSP